MPTDKSLHAVEVIVSDPLDFIQGCALEVHWIGFNASSLEKYVTKKGFPCLRFKETSEGTVFDISDRYSFDAGWALATGDHSSILLYKPDIYKLLIDNGHRLKAEYKEEWTHEEADYERQRFISARQEAKHEDNPIVTSQSPEEMVARLKEEGAKPSEIAFMLSKQGHKNTMIGRLLHTHPENVSKERLRQYARDLIKAHTEGTG